MNFVVVGQALGGSGGVKKIRFELFKTHDTEKKNKLGNITNL